MERLFEIQKFLVKKNIDIHLIYDDSKKMFYLDLNTMAKSHLYLYNNGKLYGRYDYVSNIDFSDDFDNNILQLCKEFNKALHGRNYYSYEWGQLCEENFIEIEIWV